MDSEKLNVGIEDIDSGYLVELVNDELKRLYADIRNPNKLASSSRELNLKITITAPERRKSADLKYKVSSKLGEREGGKCQIYLSGENDEVESALVPMNQQNLFEGKQAN